jgi:putative MATE family efflux protein
MIPLDRPALRREVWRQAWPLVLQNLSRMLMFWVDTAFAGRLDETSQAAMGVAGPISYTVVSVLAALSVGTIATVSRAWGEGDPVRRESEAAASAVAALLAGIPLTLIGVWALPALATLYAVPDAPGATAAAQAFLRWEAGAFLFLCLDLSASGILRGAGRTAVPMVASVAANALNIPLAWMFMFGHLGAPRLGLEGAGVATAIAMTFQGLLTFGSLWTPRSPIRLRISSLARTGRASLDRLARVVIPAAVEPLVLHAGFLAYTKLVTLLGTTALAAHRVALAVESLTFMGGYGFVMAASGLVGQALGEGRPDKADAALRECGKLALAVMVPIGLLFLVIPDVFTRVFAPLPAVAGLAAACLRIAGVNQPFMALAMTLAGGLRGAGDTRSPVATAVVGVWLVRVPLAWALAFPAGLGLRGIWITMILDWASRVATLGVVYLRGRWKAIKL